MAEGKAKSKAKVLYIAGWDRSGSTVLDIILGQLPGFFSVGELVDLWERGPDALCGCGQKLRDCKIWCQVFFDAFHVSPDLFDFAAVARLRYRCVRSRHLCLLTNRVLRQFAEMRLNRYLQILSRLYQAIGSISLAKVIVDSSKHPAYAYALKLSGADPYIVHLVRDPRGCAYSWQLSKAHLDPTIGHMPTMAPATNSLHWLVANAATRSLWKQSRDRYLRVRYEDFVSRPKEAILRIANFVEEPISDVPFLSGNSAFLQCVHGVSGNSVRFHTGAVDLKPDERWKTGMALRRRLLVTALTAPALSEYGYPFFLEKERTSSLGHRPDAR